MAPRAPKPPTQDPLQPMRRFARPAKGSHEPDLALCRYLRASPRQSSAAPYGCARTMRPEGPDGLPAQPEDCTDERPCFEAATVEGRG
jgi:hypothetical protein